MMPDPMISDHLLSSGAKVLYVAMLKLARSASVLTGVQVADITKEAGIEEATFRRQIRELEKRGWVTRSKRQSRYFEVEFVQDWPEHSIENDRVLLDQKRSSREAHSIKNDRPLDQKRSSARSKMIECEPPHPIRETLNTRETNTLASQGESPERGKPRKKKRGRTVPVVEYPLLASTPITDDPETVELVAKVHRLIIDAVNDETLAKFMDDRCRYWREQRHSGLSIFKFVEKAVARTRCKSGAALESYVAACLNGESEKRETPVAALRAKPASPPINYIVAKPRPGDPDFVPVNGYSKEKAK